MSFDVKLSTVQHLEAAEAEDIEIISLIFGHASFKQVRNWEQSGQGDDGRCSGDGNYDDNKWDGGPKLESRQFHTI